MCVTCCEEHGTDPVPPVVARVEAARDVPPHKGGECVADDEGGQDGAALLEKVPGDGEQDDGEGQQGELGARANAG